MPIWGQLELFCRAIAEEGQKEAEKILARARAEAERVVGEAREHAEKDFEREILSKRGKAYAEAKRTVDSAELEARRRIMSFREEVMGEVLDALEERLKRFTGEPSYGSFLRSALREGIEPLPGKEFVLEMSPEDLELFEDMLKETAVELAVRIEMKSSSSLEGGIRIYTADRRLLYDNGLSARLKRIENEIRQEIWREIFGAEGGEA